MPALDSPTADANSLHAELTAEACARIVAEHGSLVRAACRRILRDESLSEDAVQETFVLLVRKARTLPPRTPLAGWLYHAACCTARNHLRTAMRRHTRETSPEARAHLAPETSDDLWRELEPHLDEAMLALPARQRDLVVQCYFQNQSQREAARALGFSESVASRELHAAIETLRRFFARRGLGIGSGALVAAISANAARGVALAASAQIVGAMLAAKHLAAGVSLAALIKSGTAKIAAAILLAAGIIGYEIVSTHSRPASAFQKTEDAPLAAPIAASSNAPTPSATRESAEREAAALLAAVPRFESAGALEAAMLEAILCRDVDEQIALLQRMGVTISRSALEAEVQSIRWWTKVVNGGSMARFSVAEVARARAFFSGNSSKFGRASPRKPPWSG